MRHQAFGQAVIVSKSESKLPSQSLHKAPIVRLGPLAAPKLPDTLEILQS